jgi:hypothetical protein
MPFSTIAQELVVMDPSFSGSMSPVLSPMGHSHSDISHVHPMEESVEIEDPHGQAMQGVVINDPEHVDININVDLDEIPGAGNNLPPLEVEEASEEEGEEEEGDKTDNNDLKKKKEDRWDWEAKGPKGFVLWIKERTDSVPRHSGMDTAGLERAISYLERLDNEISKAMRLDLDGELDANKIEEVRSKIDDGLSRLEERLDKVKQSSKRKKKKKAEIIYPLGFVKEAQKITGIQGVYVTVPLLISRIARVCINGMVSAGHDIEKIFEKQAKLYNLSKRERAETMQLLEDMGYAFRQDRGYMPEDALEVSSSDGIDWNSNYMG